MAVPKRRTPPAKQGQRRSHHHVVAAQIARCPQCRSPRVNHRICPVCGSYKGRQVLGSSDSR
ncbi:MAG: 50S ribosomal protein L32 [Dehalococcoidia bacterium]|nr:50S ribosomal protein L32 [Dehalococcoidia bacterium]HRC62486.1 50S ribosomal protein L32 [Dehalococcoidia bacterium]